MLFLVLRMSGEELCYRPLGYSDKFATLKDLLDKLEAKGHEIKIKEKNYVFSEFLGMSFCFRELQKIEI